MTRESVAFLLICGFVGILAPATLLWTWASLELIAFAWPQNEGWRDWLYLFPIYVFPFLLSASLMVGAFKALNRGRPRLGIALVLAPTVLAALGFGALYGSFNS